MLLGAQRKTLSGFSSTSVLPHTGYIYHSDIVQSLPPVSVRIWSAFSDWCVRARGSNTDFHSFFVGSAEESGTFGGSKMHPSSSSGQLPWECWREGEAKGSRALVSNLSGGGRGGSGRGGDSFVCAAFTNAASHAQTPTHHFPVLNGCILPLGSGPGLGTPALEYWGSSRDRSINQTSWDISNEILKDFVSLKICSKGLRYGTSSERYLTLLEKVGCSQ